MKNFYKHPLLIAFVLSILMPLHFMSCVKKRQEPASEKPISSQQASESTDHFSYPHSKNWATTHPEFFLKNPVATGKVAESCSKCHDQLQVGKSLNISCGQNCHKVRESDPKDPGVWKVVPGTDICISCHKDQANRKYTHAPAAKGRCLSCHTKDEAHIANPKTNKPASIASASLCLKCHVSVDKHIVNHPGTKSGKACTACHDPHGSNQHFLVRENMASNCLSCHSSMKKEFETGKIHEGAQGADGCTNCHQPHGSSFAKILKEPIPVDMAAKYKASPNTYGLCFQCHDEGMLVEKIEASATSFRNDSKNEAGEIKRYNLHRFHVLEQGDSEGISCIQCHSPHVTHQDKMIRSERVNTPTDKTKINYQKTPKGGECNASCHSDEHYKYERLE